MKLTTKIAVIASLFVITNVQADDLNIGPIAIVNETGLATAVHAAAGAFTDVFNFTGASLTSSGSAVGLSFALPTTPGISFSNVDLNGVSGTIALFNGTTSFFVSNVAANNLGNYTLTVFGTASAPTANYGVTLNVSAVPETESYTMILAGIGLIGYLSKRRNQFV